MKHNTGVQYRACSGVSTPTLFGGRTDGVAQLAVLPQLTLIDVMSLSNFPGRPNSNWGTQPFNPSESRLYVTTTIISQCYC